MSIINNGLLLASGADAATTYQISRSIRLNSADSAYFSRTPGSAGNRRTWTFSCWIKRAKLGEYQAIFSAAPTAGTDDNRLTVRFDNDDKLRIFHDIGGAATTYRLTAQVFRDTSAWYHFVFVFNTTLATANDRVKVYVNGEQITTFSSSANPTLDFDTAVNNAAAHRLGSDAGATARYFDGYLADVYLLDGTATTPSTFAETDATTGQWVPKTPTGISYGTNGFRLPFSDNSGTTSTTLGKDSAGSNNWSPNNFSVASGSGNDSLTDTPTSYGTDTGAGAEVRGTYCVANPLDNGGITLANGNLDLSRNSGVEWLSIRGTIGMTSGKWYWEFTPTAFDQNMVLGIIDNTGIVTSYLDINARGYGYRPDGKKVNNNLASAYGASWTTNDVIGFAFNADNQELTFYKNGVSQGVAFTVTAGYAYFPAASLRVAGGSSSGTYNFGARAFSYQAPSGFKALCDTNLTAPTIAKPSTVFDVKFYTGNGSTQTISGLGFSPDLVWAKSRSSAAGHGLFDSVRGVSKSLSSHVTEAEGVGAAGTGVSAFNSDGFSLGPYDAAFAGNINPSGSSQVAWCWDAGTSTVTNNNGSISSQVRANASAGFSIVTYTGTGSAATVGHGLGVQPQFIIIKCRDSASDPSWIVSHTSIGLGSGRLILNTTDANTASGASVLWNSTAPTSSVFSLGNYSSVNGSTLRYVAYCFAPVAGYSSFGSYTGNGSTDGPFVYTGFKVKWLMIKRTDSTSNWYMIDASRSPYNEVNDLLYAEQSLAETVDDGNNGIDFLSNGFKLRKGVGGTNVNGSTLIYAAFAENPFAYARAR